jgi:hypothetical protein
MPWRWPKFAQSGPGYTPPALRWSFLLVLSIYICVLISILEYGRRVFPISQNRALPDSDIDVLGPFASAPLVRAEAPVKTESPLPTKTLACAAGVAPSSTTRDRRSVRGRLPGRIFARGNGTALNETCTETPTEDVDAETTTSPPIPTETKAENATFGPLKLGYRDGFPMGSPNLNSSYLNSTLLDSNNASTVARRHEDPSHYGDVVGKLQKILFAYQPPQNAEDGITHFIMYFPGDKSMDDLVNPDPEILRGIGWNDLCKIRCNGPAIVFETDVCWDMWRQANKWQDYMSAEEAKFGRVLRFEERDQEGGVRCPLRTLSSSGPSGASGSGGSGAGVSGPGGSGTGGAGLGLAPLQPITIDVDITVVITVDGVPVTTTRRTQIQVMPETEVLRDAQGRPTMTITRAPKNLKRITTTLLDFDGKPTATVIGDVELITTALTLTDEYGRPTATVSTTLPVTKFPQPTGPSVPTRWRGPETDEKKYLHPITWSDYIGATFLPVLLSLPLSIAAQVIATQLHTVLPFHALTREGGAEAEDSLCLGPGGIFGFVGSLRLLFKFHEPLSLLSDLIMLSAAVVVSISSEAVGIKLYGVCVVDNFQGCYMGMAIFDGPSRAVIVFLSFMLVVVVLTGVLQHRWKTGVRDFSRSIAGTAALLRNDETRRAFREIRSPINEKGYGYLHNQQLVEDLSAYKFSIREEVIAVVQKPQRSEELGLQPRRSGSGLARWATGLRARCHNNPSRVDNVLKGMFFIILVGFFILIVYYESTQLDTPFERFMDNQNFGVRTMFTGLGVIISFFWEYTFYRVAILEPYRRLGQAPQLGKGTVIPSPSTTPSLGLIRSLARRDFVVAAVAFTAVLSKVTPLLLANIPFNPVQTWRTHQVCSWMAVGILGLMILVLGLVWVFCKYPYMPVDPTNLAGALYYVHDSRMVADVVAGSSGALSETLSGKQYKFGTMLGVSGTKVIGVDVVKDLDGRNQD